jgi:hypothetical protein
MYCKTEDDCNTVHQENMAYSIYEKEERNRILAMTSPKRKQEAWSILFPKQTYSPEIETMIF